MKEIVPETKVPADLAKALSGAPQSKVLWDTLTPLARRDFIIWVTQSKQEATRKHRIVRTCDMLVKGKRRPCCYSAIPGDLYKAIGSESRAKSTWSTLDRYERGDFVDWIDARKPDEKRKDRVAKVVEMLAAGKKKPK